jgi:hypothetical protein
MSIGAGLAAQAGIVTETTNGTQAVVTHFVEFDGETSKMVKNTVQGRGLRAGGLFERTSRRVIGSWGATGGLNFDTPFSGLGLFLQHMMGSFAAVPVQQSSTAAYLQTHAPGTLAGKTFTLQIGKPDSSGTVRPFTYPGAKITSWEFSSELNQFLKLALEIDAWQELTPDNPQGTTAGEALATATYAAGQQFFHFRQAVIYSGGTLATTDGITTLSGPTATGRVTKASVKVENKLATGRQFMGGLLGNGTGGIKAEQLENDYRVISGALDVEFFNLAGYYDIFAGDTTGTLELQFTGPIIATTIPYQLSILVPNIKFGGDSPVVAGPGILNHNLPFTGLDDEANNPVQIQYMSTDITI